MPLHLIHLLCIIIILLASAPAIPALITFEHTGHHTHRYPSYDPFQAQVPFYNVTGLLIKPRFLSNTSCTLERNLSVILPELLDTNKQSITNTIVLLDQFESEAAGCKCIRQAVHSIAQYDQWYQALGGAPIVAAVYMMRTKHQGIPCGPHSTPRCCLSCPKLPPTSTAAATPVTLLPEAHYNAVMRWHANTSRPSVATVIQERGPWNSMAQSTSFKGLFWAFAFVNCCFLVKALSEFIRVIAHGKSRMNLRIVVFLLAICSILKSVIQMEHRMNMFKLMLHAIFSVNLISVIMLLIARESEHSFREDIVQAATTCMAVSYSCFALLFVYYAIFFYNARDEYTINPASFRTLTKLSKISMASFIAMLFTLVAHLVYCDRVLGHTIYGFWLQLALRDLNSAICSGVILFVIGIRMPNEEDAKASAVAAFRSHLQHYLALFGARRGKPAPSSQ
ncbi:hypothetical protein SYNPS1DRAFT_29537 [Syncephalis pseudoplumigaleata]|uniref:Uncharacterized protein n=1 Tax=Syncephalis pseudoplumigaleata TaxID=1712513 RepID=A0A4P9YXD1_9FUNG|nr:hypothetical protein SYNPS1DRAFT_29537 [Syncephalis pseudoplumigaleata]|eukprot:RKP24707.1 hypothetical protein SYNPS1DRAFT_29537 [Syncephalis pseudoplumigaleata]